MQGINIKLSLHGCAGATFNRGFNRALGSLVAGIFAIVVIQVAMSFGHVAEPYVIGLSIFLIGMYVCMHACMHVLWGLS